MNTPNNPTTQNASIPFSYEPPIYESPFLNGLSQMGVDSNANPMATANFYNYGWHGFGDQLPFSNFGYFNTTPGQYFPNANLPSTSLASPSITQTSALYHHNVDSFGKQAKSTPNSDAIRAALTSDSKSSEDGKIQKGKTKRKRILFSAEQVRIMEEHFMISQNTQHTDRLKLSKIIGLSPQQIKIWFQNRRYKEKLTRRELNNSSVKKPIRSEVYTSPITSDTKSEFKSEVGTQPAIYSNWQQNTHPTPSLFPFNTEMYAGGFVNYPQMFPDFNNPGSMSQFSLSYYNQPNGPTNPP